MTRNVVPPLVVSISARCTTFAVSWSNVPVGSSAKSKTGANANCRASTILCFSPPLRSRVSGMFTRCSIFTDSRISYTFFSLLLFGYLVRSKASKIFQMTPSSLYNAKLRCNMIAIALFSVRLISLSCQKFTSLNSNSVPHLGHLSPTLLGPSNHVQAGQYAILNIISPLSGAYSSVPLSIRSNTDFPAPLLPSSPNGSSSFILRLTFFSTVLSSNFLLTFLISINVSFSPPMSLYLLTLCLYLYHGK